MMYLVSDNNFAIIKTNDDIPSIKIGKEYIANMGQLRPYKSYDTMLGITGDEMFEWLFEHGYKHIKEEAELARLLLILE